jgi:hypothetical protein
MAKKLVLPTLVVILLLLLGATVWVGSGNAPRATSPTKPPKFLQCPECNNEIPFIAKLEGKPCEVCHKGKLVASARSFRDPDTSAPITSSPLVVGTLLVLGILGAIHLYVIVRSRQPRARTVDYLYARCPACKRRVRYPENQVQRKILCPTCRLELDVVPGRPRRS